MAYSFKPDDRSVTAGLRRIACDQIDTALDESRDDTLPRPERIHQLRKRCKKLRGLIRLVRPVFDGYTAENAAFRDIARSLSDVRDAGAMVETCDRLIASFEGPLADDPFPRLRAHLADTARACEHSPDLDRRLDAARDALHDARARAADWTLDSGGAEAITGGLAKTYARARAAMETALDTRDGGDLHAWRKRVKYHWYHLRLLKHVSPMLAAQIAPAEALSDLLGDHHDLHVMDTTLADLPEDIPADEIATLSALSQRQRRAMEARAAILGPALFAEKPKALARRTGAYWSAWSAPEPSAMAAL